MDDETVEQVDEEGPFRPIDIDVPHVTIPERKPGFRLDGTPASGTGGRPPKFNEETCNKILHYLAMGASYTDATEAAGVTYRQFRHWMRLASDPEQPEEFRVFAEAVEQVRGLVAVEMAARIKEAAKDPRHWKAAHTWLRTFRPESWRDVDSDKTNINISGGQTIVATSDDILRLQEALQRRAGSDVDETFEKEAPEGLPVFHGDGSVDEVVDVEAEETNDG